MRMEAANLFAEASNAALQAANFPPLHHHLLVRAQQLRLAVAHLHVELRLVAANNQKIPNKSWSKIYFAQIIIFYNDWSLMPGL